MKLLALFPAFCVASNIEWENYKLQYGKAYPNLKEDADRFAIYQNHVRKVIEHNKLFSEGLKTYTKKINEFSDMTFEEFSKTRLMKPRPLKDGEADMSYPGPFEFECPEEFISELGDEGIPQEFATELNWLDASKNPKNLVAVTPVKDQAACGSCYTFSAVSAMESSLCFKGFKSDCENWNGLSEQHVLNCGSYITQAEYDFFEKNKDKLPEGVFETFPQPEDHPWRNFHGCQGGEMANVFQFIYHEGFIVENDLLPYRSGNSSNFDYFYGVNVEECPYTKQNQGQFMKSIGLDKTAYVSKTLCGTTSKRRSAFPEETHNKDPENIKKALFEKGPLSIAFFATDEFVDYAGGVYVPNETECKGYTANHAVNIVGYGHDEDSGLDYWLIRNSWSSDWGDNGYVKFRMGHNDCNVESNVVYVDMETQYPEPRPKPENEPSSSNVILSSTIFVVISTILKML